MWTMKGILYFFTDSYFWCLTTQLKQLYHSGIRLRETLWLNFLESLRREAFYFFAKALAKSQVDEQVYGTVYGYE